LRVDGASIDLVVMALHLDPGEGTAARHAPPTALP
jgi:hypothetical protein